MRKTMAGIVKMILQPRKRLAIFLLTAIFALILSGVGLYWSRSPLDRATRIPAVPLNDNGIELDDFRCIPQHRLVAFHEDSRGWYPYTLDVVNSQKQRLEPLHSLIVAQHTWKPSWVRWEVSPDGKWLLWGLSSAMGPSEYCVAALDGSAIHVWRNQQRERNYSIVWQADSRA